MAKPHCLRFVPWSLPRYFERCAQLFELAVSKTRLWLDSSFFSFTNGSIGSSSWNGSTFTITAIPEPSTYLAAIGLLALMLWPLRHRLCGKAS